MQKFKKKSIVIFDGACNLCNSSINFIIKHDKKNNFLFASLQSDAAKDLLLHYRIKNFETNTIILIEEDNFYIKSTAVLKIAKHLNAGIKFFYVFILTPKIIRNFVYDFIAKRRFRWFGKRAHCLVPSKALKNKFIE